VKRLVRVLCSTRAYQLDSKPPTAGTAGRSAPAAERATHGNLPSGARGATRPASPDSFSYALDKPLSAEQLFRSLLAATENQPDKDGKIAGRTEKELRQAFVAQFPDLFSAEYNASLQQAMFFSNSPLLDALLAPRERNLVARLTALPGNEARVREAFAAIYGREPSREELRECERYLAARSTEAGVKQLLWAMLTSAEFQLNH
jgi:hypothetical protein